MLRKKLPYVTFWGNRGVSQGTGRTRREKIKEKTIRKTILGGR